MEEVVGEGVEEVAVEVREINTNSRRNRLNLIRLPL